MRRLGLFMLLVLNACTSVKPLPPQPPAQLQVTIPLRVDPGALSFAVLGTEPFWSIRTSETELVYSTPELPDGVRIKAVWGFTSNGMEAFSGDQTNFWQGRMEGKPLRLEIKRGQCSDGMSDAVYDYTAKLTIGERTEQGCARRK